MAKSTAVVSFEDTPIDIEYQGVTNRVPLVREISWTKYTDKHTIIKKLTDYFEK